MTYYVKIEVFSSDYSSQSPSEFLSLTFSSFSSFQIAYIPYENLIYVPVIFLQSYYRHHWIIFPFSYLPNMFRNFRIYAHCYFGRVSIHVFFNENSAVAMDIININIFFFLLIEFVRLMFCKLFSGNNHFLRLHITAALFPSPSPLYWYITLIFHNMQYYRLCIILGKKFCLKNML